MTLYLLLYIALAEKRVKLFDLNFSTCFFKSGFDLFSFCFRYFFFDSVRSCVSQILCFFKTKSEGFLNGLNDLKFSLTC